MNKEKIREEVLKEINWSEETSGIEGDFSIQQIIDLAIQRTREECEKKFLGNRFYKVDVKEWESEIREDQTKKIFEEVERYGDYGDKGIHIPKTSWLKLKKNFGGEIEGG